MNAGSEQRPQSWRQSGSPRRSTPGGTVRGRRIITSTLLLILLAAGIWLVWSLANSRYQHTTVASLFTASRTQTSEPEQPFSLAPLRFASESISPLLAEETEEFSVQSLNSSSDHPEYLANAISQLISRMGRDDALILWIRAKGVGIDGAAYLLNGEYRLPMSGQELSDPRGAIPLRAVLKSVSEWKGPSLLLLDWGNQLADARAGFLDNRFLPLALEDIAACPARVHCLVSHLDGELSLDSLAESQTLFGRACAEAMVGPRRLPDDYQSIVPSSHSLMLGDLAEYVIRRVQADSSGLQTPWLVQGEHGWMSGEAEQWTQRTSIPVARLATNGRPLGWANALVEDEVEPSDEAGVAASNPATNNLSDIERQSLPSAIWPTGTLWQSLEGWQNEYSDYINWNHNTLAPITARRLRTQLRELEARWFAGQDFQDESGARGIRAQIDRLSRDIERRAAQIEAARRTPELAMLGSPKPAEIAEIRYQRWQMSIAALAAYRDLALRLTDAAKLGDELLRLGSIEIATDLSQRVRQAMGAIGSFLMEKERQNDSLASVDPGLLREQLLDARSNIDASISKLVELAAKEPSRYQPVAELLLRYTWLSHSQRQRLLQSLLRPLTATANATASQNNNKGSFWPTKDLALLTPPQPRARPGTTTLWSELLRHAGPSAARTLDTNINSDRHIIDQLASSAAELASTNRINEGVWVAVDGRDLCLKEGGWSPESQHPVLPAPPAPVPQWRIAFDNPAGGSLLQDRLELESSTEPANLDLLLNRIGTAEDIESVQLSFSGLLVRVRSDGEGWQRQQLTVSKSQLLSLANASPGVQLLPLQLKALGTAVQNPALQVSVRAGGSSPPLKRLTCHLPIPIPVYLTLQQLVTRDGQTNWVDCEHAQSILTLQPFAGRSTPYRLALSNVDERPRTATVDLYRLPPRSRETAKGRLAGVDAQLPKSIEQIQLGSLERFAVSQPVILEPGQQDLIVSFASGEEDAVESDNPQAPGQSGGISTDTSWGMLAVVRLASEPTKVWKNWIQIQPKQAIDYLQVESRVLSGSRSIEFLVKLRDANRDGKPDLLPPDIEQNPMVIQCEIGNGMDLQKTTLPPMRRVLGQDAPEQRIMVRSAVAITDEVEFRVNVDESPRALIHFVGVDGRVGRREPPDRLWVRQVRVKDGPIYTSEYRTEYLENETRLDEEFGATFGRPLTSPIEFLFAVDSQTRNRPAAMPIPAKFQIVGDGWQHLLGHVYGDRNLSATLEVSDGEMLKLYCQLSDWTFTFATESRQDFQAAIQGEIRDGRPQRLSKLTFDSRGPVQLGTASAKTVFAGENSQLIFSIQDVSPVSNGKVFVRPNGQPSKSQQIGDDLDERDFVRVPGGWRLRPLSLAVAELPAGQYQVRAEVADVVGNSSLLGPWPLLIREKPTPPGEQPNDPQPYKGAISGKLFFGSSLNRPPNKVKVSLKELDRSTTTASGEFSFPNVVAGSHTVEATMTWQGVRYKGEKKILLEKREDWSREIVISLEKE